MWPRSSWWSSQVFFFGSLLIYLVFLHVWLCRRFIPLLMDSRKGTKKSNLWNAFRSYIAFEYRLLLIFVPVASFGKHSISPVHTEDELSSIRLHHRPRLILKYKRN